MQKSFFFSSPVEVVKVTSSNLAEVAEWCGGEIAETESRNVPGRMDKYVWVPTPKGTTISWAFPGMYITKRLVLTVKDDLRATYAVFRKDYFQKNYFENPDIAINSTWERYFKEEAKKAQVAPKPAAPKNHLKGTSMEDYVPDNGESVKVKVTQKGTGVETIVDLSEAVTVSEARRGVQVAPANEGVVASTPEEPTVDEVAVVAEAAIEVEEKILGEDADVDFRSAETGQFVTEEFAAEHPATTVAEKSEVSEVTDEDIDKLHGKGAAAALDAAIADGSIFSDSSKSDE